MGYEDIPDEAPERLEQLLKVPSYKMICIAILKNDYALATLGYSRTKTAGYNEIKKSELIRNGKIEPDKQLELF